ncbi:MAG: hypothetical protein ACF8Q5_13990 [Phycisphaerales bacterium JB040]
MSGTHLGIDAGARWVKAVETGRRGQVLRTAMFPRSGDPLGPEGVSRIAATLRRKGFTSRSATLVCPRDSVHRRIVSLPQRRDNERDSSIVAGSFESEGVGGGASEPVWWELGSRAGSEHREVLAYAVDAERAMSWYRSFEREGLDLVSIDLHPSAAGRLAGPELTVVADVAYSHLGLTLALERRPVYERHDPGLGLGHLLTLEGRRLGQPVEDAETLALRHATLDRGEIAGFQGWAQRVSEGVLALTQYAQRRYPGSDDPRVLLVGGGATPGVAEALGRLTGLRCGCVEGACDAMTCVAWSASGRVAA